MRTTDIRAKFLAYFAEQGHHIVRSSPLVPGNDATLLFTNAGMVQFKDVFLGSDPRPYQRATSSQRCVRAGGKHNDLENVGYTARHHTFFEMLGNFSFGDYFKHDAIRFAWAFLTQELALPADKLWVTVFEEDDEAFDIWANEVGVPRERIARIGAKDNFWQMGETGPCGPCSEIFYDHGPDVWGGPPGTPEEDGDRYIEIWNLVFMQYDRSADGTLTPLPRPSVDTGMGLERIAAVLQHVHSNYEIDLFAELIAAAAQLVACEDQEHVSLKVLADHIRSCAFLMVDGVQPSNEGRGYVLRRIIRRALRHGYQLGQTKPFFHQLVAPLVTQMGEAYPELVDAQAQITAQLKKEEERFLETLALGMGILNQAIAELDGDTVPGEVAFVLYDTYGFPLDLTADVAREHALSVDTEGFDTLMQAQRQRARAASQFAADTELRVSGEVPTVFVGYTEDACEAQVLELYNAEGASVERLDGDGWAVLDRSPFYAESGGQVGDTGQLLVQGTATAVSVSGTRKQGSTWVHQVHGTLQRGESVQANIDTARRAQIVANHSATHLLHAALRQSVGEHVQQRGSLVHPDYLRFDFSHDAGIDAQALVDIEAQVNAWVRRNDETIIREMSLDEAKAAGAMALFGEKYGDTVRVVRIGEDSLELCGGVHVARSGEIGAFRIRSEAGIASGIRRIEALTGAAADAYGAQQAQQLAQVAQLLRTSAEDTPARLQIALDKTKSQQRQIDQLQSQLALSQFQSTLASPQRLSTQAGEIAMICAHMGELESKGLRELVDSAKSRLGTCAVVLGSVEAGRVRLIAGVSKDLSTQLKAGDLVNHVAQQVGGKGGGRPELAQAGGDQPQQLDAALASVQAYIEKRLS